MSEAITRGDELILMTMVLAALAADGDPVGIGTRKLREMAQDCLVPATRRNGRWYIARRDLQAVRAAIKRLA